MGALPSLQPVSGLAPDRVAAALGLDTVSRGDVILLQGDDPHVEAAALASVSEAIWGHSDLPIDAVFVPARPKLLHGTLLDNLSGFEKAREEKAKQLSGDIGLDPMIGRLARGMSTEVGDGTGGGLSSGGVKRVGLVAALAASPSVLVLERPEVELDMDGVARLAAMIDAVRDDMVTVLTSSAPAIHELANIKSAGWPNAGHEGRAA
jgi:ABC-type protease/lipase transport system fused ATPase/permease subunit